MSGAIKKDLIVIAATSCFFVGCAPNGTDNASEESETISHEEISYDRGEPQDLMTFIRNGDQRACLDEGTQEALVDKMFNPDRGLLRYYPSETVNSVMSRFSVSISSVTFEGAVANRGIVRCAATADVTDSDEFRRSYPISWEFTATLDGDPPYKLSSDVSRPRGAISTLTFDIVSTTSSSSFASREQSNEVQDSQDDLREIENGELTVDDPEEREAANASLE